MMSENGLSWNDLDSFGVDGKGRLLWKGEPVVTESRIHLQTYQVFLASIGAVGALLAGVHPFGHSFGWW
jgi:hypothetical protein